MVNKISIKDDFARFTLLTPEQQEWIESNKLQRLVGIGKVYSCDQNNIDTAYSIAKIFPIRLRWWKQDRFGYWYRSTKHTASHFTIDCRLQEILIRRVRPTVIANEIVGVQPMTGPVGQIHTTKG